MPFRARQNAARCAHQFCSPLRKEKEREKAKEREREKKMKQTVNLEEDSLFWWSKSGEQKIKKREGREEDCNMAQH